MAESPQPLEAVPTRRAPNVQTGVPRAFGFTQPTVRQIQSLSMVYVAGVRRECTRVSARAGWSHPVRGLVLTYPNEIAQSLAFFERVVATITKPIAIWMSSNIRG